MRTAALTLLSLVAFGYAAMSQKFSLLPQVGFENSKTNINYNDLRSFSPLGVKFSPQVSLRLSYASKQGHGFFIGVASSRSIVSFSFTDPENGMNNFLATTGNMQLRLEGGYQFNTQPIHFNNKAKQPSAEKGTATNAAKTGCGSNYSRSSCTRSSASSHHCCTNANKAKSQVQGKDRGTWVRIQPSIGMGYIPAVKTDVITKTQAGETSYEYRAGNWNTALITGAGFEFGRKNTRLFTVSINYFKGLGHLDGQTISSLSGAKTVTTTLESSVSGWNMKIGIPFTLGTKKPAIKNRTEKKTEQQKSGCGQYRIMYRCGKSN
jgi:hypothetical protein